jgi:C2 domain
MDTFSLTDAIVLVYLLPNGVLEDKKCLGNTEPIFNSLNPDFTTSILIQFDSEKDKKNKLRFEVYDVDDESEIIDNLDNQEIIGQVTVEIATLVTAG